MENRKRRVTNIILFAKSLLMLLAVAGCDPPEYPAPVIISIDRKSGSPSDIVVITGKYLRNVTGLYFGDNLLTSANNGITITDDNTVITHVPSQTPGKVEIALQYQGKKSAPISFEILQPVPTISVIEPLPGKIGDKITIVGKNFVSGMSIHFNGPATAVTLVVSETVLTSTIPSQAKGGYVYLYGDGVHNSDSVYYSIGNATQESPHIDKIEPSSAKLGDVISITGSNFKKLSIKVTFSGDELLSPNDYKIDSDTKITLKVPSDAVSGAIEITNEKGGDGREFAIIGPPIVYRIVPASNQVGGPIIIYGKYLEGVESILFGSKKVLKANFNYQKDIDGKEVLYGRVPVLNAGEVDLVVTGVKSGDSESRKYTVRDGDPLDLPTGFANVLFPYSSSSPSLYGMNNQWSVSSSDERYFVNYDPIPIAEGVYGLTDGNNNLGYFQKNGSFISINVSGVFYEGKRDMTYEQMNISRIILTPTDFGTQQELIFPTLLEKVEPIQVTRGKELSIYGRYFSLNEFGQYSGGQVVIDDVNLIDFDENGDVNPTIGYVRDSRYKLRIKIATDTKVGQHKIRLSGGGFDSNEIVFQVK